MDIKVELTDMHHTALFVPIFSQIKLIKAAQIFVFHWVGYTVFYLTRIKLSTHYAKPIKKGFGRMEAIEYKMNNSYCRGYTIQILQY